MIRKKRWLKPGSIKILNRTKTNDVDISWSSSSSDADNKVNSNYSSNRKKLKTTRIKPTIGEITPTKYNYNSDLSPIIGKSVPEELSPTLNSRNDDELDKSPIIGKNLRVRSWRKQINSPAFRDKFRPFTRNEVERNCSNRLNISTYSSSDSSETEDSLSISQLSNTTSYNKMEPLNSDDEMHSISQDSSNLFSQIHTENIHIDSEKSSSNSQQILISQYSSSRDSPVFLISQNATQNNSDLVANSTVDATAASLSVSPVFFYQTPPRRKRYKKNGLAKQLQKCLKRKEASVSIWRHELYLNKNNQSQDFLCLQVLKTHEEFQNIVLQCNLVYNNLDSSSSSSTCMAVLNNSVKKIDTCPKIVKLYKPYDEAIIHWNGQNVCCYYNICKILFDF